MQLLKPTFTLDRTVRLFVALLVVGLLATLLSLVWEVLLPFLLAGIFAYVVMPLVRFVQTRLYVRHRGAAVGIVFVLIGFLVFAGLSYIVPAVESEVSKTIQALQQYGGKDGLLEMVIPADVLTMWRETFRLEGLTHDLTPERLADFTKTVWEQTSGIISGTLSFFSWSMVFAMGLVYFIFIMIDFEGLARGFVDLFPHSMRPTIEGMCREMDYFMNSYFRGQALIALSVGVLCTIAFNIVGLPMATALGIFIGILNFIPYMQALGILPLALSAILMGAQTGQNVFVCILLAGGALLVVQVIQDTILVPRIMGSSMGMRPSLILLALALWGSLLGFFGLLIALPMTMALYSMYMRYVLEDKAYIRMMDEKMKQRKGAAPSADK